MSATSLTVFLKLNFDLLISNFPFSIRLTSSASSITFSRCVELFYTILRYLMIKLMSKLPDISIWMTINKMGRMELSGVLSSCAHDEKNLDLIFLAWDSTSMILVMSVKMAISWFELSASIYALLTWIYLLGFFDLKTISLP